MEINAIFATSEDYGFGYEKTMPWPRIKEDMQHFQKTTHNTAIIMGYTTYQTLPTLPYRYPIVCTTKDLEGVAIFNYRAGNLIEVLKDAQSNGVVEKVNIIGGTSLLTLENLQGCNYIYHTAVRGTFPTTVFMDKEVVDWVTSLPVEEVIADTDKCTITKYRVVNETNS